MTTWKAYECILLDMNGTFMFGEDRFGAEEDFGREYKEQGGSRSGEWANKLIRDAFHWLEIRYPDPEFHREFPTVSQAFLENSDDPLPESELRLLVNLFAQHEIGHIPAEFAEAVKNLSSKYRLGLVADIWAPAPLWWQELSRAGIRECFESACFSSDVGIVKPAPDPFLRVISQMGVDPAATIYAGDSIRRDLGGATAAGIGCVLVGGGKHPDASAHFPSLLEFAQEALES